MTDPSNQLLHELRDAFDVAFQVPRTAVASDGVDLLAIRLAGRAFCIRILDLQAVSPLPPIVALPRPDPLLLGVGGHRGRLIAVFSLAALLALQHEAAAETDDPGQLRWLLIPGGDASIGLACASIDGYLRLPAKNLRAGRPGPVSATVTEAGEARGVLDLNLLLQRLHGRTRARNEV